ERFHQLSAAALVSNVLLVPMSGGLMYEGFALTLVQWLAPGAAPTVARLVSLSLSVFESTVRYFAGWGLFWRVTPPHPALLLPYYAAVLCLWCRRHKGYNAAIEK